MSIKKEVLVVMLVLFVPLFASDVFAITVGLYRPVDNDYLSSAEVNTTCIVMENSLDNITLYHNASGWAANETNSSPVELEYTPFTNNFDEGTYVWNCLACNITGSCAFASQNRTFTVDLTKPSVVNASASIINATNITNFQLNVTASDANGVASVYANGVQMSSAGGSIYTATTNGSALGCGSIGNCTITFNATDYAGNYNDSAAFSGVFIDDIPPSVTSPSVSSSVIRSAGGIDINVTVIDNLSISSVTVGNSSPVQMSLLTGDIYNATATGTAMGCNSDGVCTLTFNATDELGNINSSVTTTITIDETGPAVTSPAASVSFAKSTANFQINVTVADAYSTVSSVTVSGGNALNMANVSATLFTLTTNGSALGCSEGSCILTFNATDELGNSNFSVTTSVTIDDTVPAVTSPTANATKYKSSASIRIDVTVTDANPMSSVTLNNTLLSNSSATAWNVTGTVSTLIGAAEGSYTHNFTATDAAGNVNNTVGITVTVDDSAPTISSVSVSVSTSSATVTWTTNEDANSRIDYSTNSSDLANSSAVATYQTSQSVSLSGLTASTLYYYNTTSCDEAGNCNTTGTHNFTTSSPAAPPEEEDEETERKTSDTYVYTGITKNPKAVAIWGSISAGESIEFSISNDKIDVRDLKVVLRRGVSDARITVEQLSEKPSEVEDVAGTGYSYLKMEWYNGGDGDVEEAVIKFMVSKEWLSDNGLLEGHVVLQRYSGGRWHDLNTRVVGTDLSYVYFEASSPGFSYFAITAKEAPEEEIAEEVEEEAVEEIAEEEPAEEMPAVPEVAPPASPEKVEEVSPASKILKWGLIGVLVLALIVAVIQNIREKRLKEKY